MCKISSVLVALSALVLVTQIGAQLRGLAVPNEEDKFLQGEFRRTFLDSAAKANMTDELRDYILNFKKADGEQLKEELTLVYKQINWSRFTEAVGSAFADLSSQFMGKSKDMKHLSEITNLINKFGIAKQ